MAFSWPAYAHFLADGFFKDLATRARFGAALWILQNELALQLRAVYETGDREMPAKIEALTEAKQIVRPAGWTWSKIAFSVADAGLFLAAPSGLSLAAPGCVVTHVWESHRHEKMFRDSRGRDPAIVLKKRHRSRTSRVRERLLSNRESPGTES